MKEIAIIGNYPELNEYPTIFLFSVLPEYEKTEVVNLFEIGMDVAKSQSENDMIVRFLTKIQTSAYHLSPSSVTPYPHFWFHKVSIHMLPNNFQHPLSTIIRVTNPSPIILVLVIKTSFIFKHFNKFEKEFPFGKATSITIPGWKVHLATI